MPEAANSNRLQRLEGDGMPTSSRTRAENAIAMLKNDHQKVIELFDKFEDSKSSAAQGKIVAKAIQELKVHATIEEQLFYPSVRQQIDDEDGIMPEADEEHHVAKILIAELENMKGDEEHWEAKFMVLAESVRHHSRKRKARCFPRRKRQTSTL